MRNYTPASSVSRLVSRAMILASLLVILVAAAKMPAAAAPNVPDATLRFSEPNGSGDVTAEGDDFFTNRLGDPIDFNNPADIDWPVGWRSQSMSNGVWTGVSSASDANFFLLFPGFDIAANGIDSRNGQVYQIDPNRYSHLVFKYTASANTNVIAYWMPQGDPYSHGFGNSPIYGMPAGANIIDIDLTKTGSGPAWTSGQWGGLRFQPGFGTPGVQVQLDWVRLVPASSSPTFTAHWTCSACSGNIDLYADLDNNNGNGGAVLLASGVSANAGQYNVPTAKLAGGNYYLVAKGSVGTVYSSGTFSVREAPIVNITAPSTTSGEDYATSVLGKPWNMTTASALAGVGNISNWQVGSGVAQGHPTNGDPAVYLLNANGPAIDTARFKYLSFSLTLTQPGASPFQLARVLWFNTPLSPNQTGDIITWYNYRQYYNMDLSRTKLASAPQGWSGSQAVLRIDPTEQDDTYGVPPLFQLGPVTLTGDQKVSQGQTTSVRWQLVRGGGTVALSYRPTSGGNWTQFASGINASAGGYSWNTGSVAPGAYTIRAVVSDGANNSEWLSKTPLVVTSGSGGGGSNFSDVASSDYFFTPVLYLTSKGIISGYADGTFRPFNNTTRSQTAKILTLAKGYALLNPASPRFRDVPRDNPFYQFVETAASHGLISGYADGNFRPYDNVTRAQLAKMIVVAQNWSLVRPSSATFNDVPVGSTFFTYIETAYRKGILSGYNDGSFRPGANAVRGQLSKIVYQALNSAVVENNASKPSPEDEQQTPESK